MKHLRASLLAAALALASLGAHAGTFNFSYSFDPANTGDGNPVLLSGSFTGTQIGALITGIGNLQVSLNGTAFDGPLTVEAWNSVSSNWDASTAAVISTDVAQTNFIVADADVSTNPYGVSNYFFITGGQAFAVNFNATDAGNNPLEGYEAASNDHWTVTAAAVPEPATAALLLSGMGLLGVLASRRNRG